jgi:hypothetical protein
LRCGQTNCRLICQVEVLRYEEQTLNEFGSGLLDGEKLIQRVTESIA